MKDYQEQLKAFAFPDSKEQTEEYFKKYWLTKEEMIEYWLEIKNIIYNKKFNTLPDKLFNEKYRFILTKGGLIFIQKDFNSLQFCMNFTRDKYFVIIEDYDMNNPPHNSGPPLRFKYQVNISWNEINISDGICYELFQRPVRNYFVFGDSGNWGKYIANDYKHPLDVIGFKEEVADVFKKEFKISDEEQKEIYEWLSEDYKAIVE